MSHSWIQKHPHGVVLLVRVQPKASRAGIGGEWSGRLKVRLNSPPEGGKANRELVALVAKRLGIAKSRVSIVKGEKGKEKSLLCMGIDEKGAEGLLGGD